jgi:hypothetical protein
LGINGKTWLLDDQQKSKVKKSKVNYSKLSLSCAHPESTFMREWRYAPLIPNHSTRWEVSGQLHVTPTVLPAI